jgi:hypothetical protein
MKRLAVTVVLAMGISFPILADAPRRESHNQSIYYA